MNSNRNTHFLRAMGMGLFLGVALLTLFYSIGFTDKFWLPPFPGQPSANESPSAGWLDIEQKPLTSVPLHPIFTGSALLALFFLLLLFVCYLLFNIYQRHKAEKALIDSERIYRQAIENASGVPYELHYDTYEYAFMGEDIGSLVGIPKDQFRFQSFQDLVQDIILTGKRAPEDPLEYGKAFRKGQHAQFRADLRIITPAGEHKWISDCSVPLRDKQTGEIIGSLGILQDITERKINEENLRQSEDRLRSLFEGITDTIIVYDASGQILDANEFAGRRLGYCREELLSISIREIEPLEFFKTFPQRLQEQDKKGRFRGEGELLTREGKPFPVDLNTTLIHYKGKPAYLAVIRDITLRKQAEGEREALRKLAQKLTAPLSVRDIGRTVAHESRQFFQHDALFISMLNETEQQIYTVYKEDTPAGGREPKEYAPDGNSVPYSPEQPLFCGKSTLINRAAEEFGDNGLTPFGEDKRPSRSLMFVPIVWEQKSIGVLSVQNYTPNKYNRRDLDLLRSFADQCGAALVRARDNEVLRQNEYRLKILFEYAPEAYYLYDFNGRFLDANRAMEKLLGYEKEELLTMNVRDLHLGPLTRTVGPHLNDEKLEEENRPGPFEFQLVRKDGAPVLVEAGAYPVKIDDQFLMLGLARDITARKQAEEQLTLLGTAIDQAAESIVITDAEGIIQYVNPAFEKITGYCRKEAIGENPSFLKSGVHGETFYRNFWETIKKGEVWAGRFTNKRKDGQLYEEEATISPIRDATGRTVNYVAVKRDISEVVSLENQLRQSQKMEAIGRLAGGVAHDFNNLLQAIIGHTDLCLKKMDSDSDYFSDLIQVRKASEKAASLTRQLLAFSRRQVLQAVDADLNQIIGDFMKILRRMIGEHVELDIRPGAELSTINADPAQIEQVLMNLCVNARDAMPDGGQITIRTSNYEIDQRFLEKHPWARDGQYVMMSVEDKGEGIPREALDHIFEPFFTTKETGQGTGLGLATVYGIVKQHNGYITVESEPGEGTRFNIFLPTVDRPVMAQTRETPALAVGGNETILLAEDEELVRDLAVQILREAGYRVLIASDGEEALEVFEKRGRNIDLILLDMVMPKISGRAVYEKILKMKPDIRALFCSGYSVEDQYENFPSLQNVDLIPKPYKPNELLQKVREILDRNPADQPLAM